MQLRVFSSLFMGRTWLNSCELANVRCHAALSDGKHMSTEVEKKNPASVQPGLSHDTMKGGERAADTSLALLAPLSAPANNESLVSLISQKQY